MSVISGKSKAEEEKEENWGSFRQIAKLYCSNNTCNKCPCTHTHPLDRILQILSKNNVCLITSGEQYPLDMAKSYHKLLFVDTDKLWTQVLFCSIFGATSTTSAPEFWVVKQKSRKLHCSHDTMRTRMPVNMLIYPPFESFAIMASFVSPVTLMWICIRLTHSQFRKELLCGEDWRFWMFLSWLRVDTAVVDTQTSVF